jgi:hypothetical protein
MEWPLALNSLLVEGCTRTALGSCDRVWQSGYLLLGKTIKVMAPPATHGRQATTGCSGGAHPQRAPGIRTTTMGGATMHCRRWPRAEKNAIGPGNTRIWQPPACKGGRYAATHWPKRAGTLCLALRSLLSNHSSAHALWLLQCWPVHHP